jgi:amino acid transporter
MSKINAIFTAISIIALVTSMNFSYVNLKDVLKSSNYSLGKKILHISGSIILYACFIFLNGICIAQTKAAMAWIPLAILSIIWIGFSALMVFVTSKNKTQERGE